jgi:phosphatidylinositol alpha-1,6-mannosyltransferase
VWWAKVFPFSLAIRRIGSSIDSLTYLGEFTRKAISRALTPQAQQRMVRIAPGIDIEHFAPLPEKSAPDILRQELGLENKKLIVSVGRLVHRKGQDRLIEALAVVRREIPEAHLLLVGEGPYRQTLEAIAAKVGVSESVTFIGRVQYAELPRYIRCGDLFAMPSRSRFRGLEVEGLGIVYLEASACGLPVIAGNSGGAPDAVVDGKTGIVVDGTNAGEIAGAIVKILNDPAMADRMGKAGREWIVDQWSWENWSRKFQQVLGI